MVTPRKHIESLHKSGSLRNVSVKTKDGQTLSGTKLRDFLVGQSKQHATLATLRQGLHKDVAWSQRGKLDKLLRPEPANATSQSKRSNGFFGGLFSTPKKEKPKPLPWYRRAARLEDDAEAQQMSQRTGVSISQFRGGVSKVSVDTSAQGGRQNQTINPLTGQPIAGGIGRSGSSVGSSSGGGGGKPPLPLAN